MTTGSDFYLLTPDAVLQAAEFAGFRPTGELTQLNSYENRVFDLRLEDGKNIIAKFYRPQRWSEKSILEEHSFLKELRSEGIEVIAPLEIHAEKTLLRWNNLWTAFFPKFRGRLPNELLPNDRRKVGRLLARIHNVGAQKEFRHRPVMDESWQNAFSALKVLEPIISLELKGRYLEAAETIIEAHRDIIDPKEFIRIHGDVHRGNLLTDTREFFFVDFDDCMMGPVVQDFWMLLSGDNETDIAELEEILSGYEELRSFPEHQWEWVPILRGLRIIGYAAWIARRWQDPSFPRIFPEFGTYRYWAEETESLEKIAWKI
ncbi:MAG: serine/threonine protein kinase [Bdellovibrionaceae bacterium]|nr:serine/threonine protein kinase [Pseudobdellovibrionaceae bacterium]